MKKYYVFLDESGDFDKDLADVKKSGSLVGGYYYCVDSLRDKTRFINHINGIMADENHATELRGEHKGEKVLKMLSGVQEYPIEFVIFQNDVKKKIINSTQTYLTVLTEGLIQLLKSLVLRENDSIELTVVIGYKKDTTQAVTNSMVEGYIPIDAYKDRVAEKLAIEKAKLYSPQFLGSSISCQLADDKRDSRLVLCDYICNFWLTKQSSSFSKIIQWNGKQKSIAQIIRGFYKKKNIFPLFITEEDDYVFRLLQDGFYADALFEICAGNLSEPNCNRIRDSFTKLKPKQIDIQLRNLSDYIEQLIQFKQSPAVVETVLNNARRLYKSLKAQLIIADRFYLDINLYLLAFLNNNGRFAEMETLFAEIEPAIAEYSLRELESDYLLIYYIRKAVYLTDHNKYNEAVRICEGLESHLMFIEDALRNNDCIRLEGEVRSEKLGQVLGTKLQAQIPLCLKHTNLHKIARETSDRAIEQFSFKHDIIRQYQYRAELEAVCGNQQAAIKWLEKSFNGIPWKQHLSSANRNIFDLYNLLYIAAFTTEKNLEASLEIVNTIYNTHMKDIEQAGVLRGYCLLFMGVTYMEKPKNVARGQKILKMITENQKDCVNMVIQAAIASLQSQNGLEMLYEEKG